MRVLIVLRDDGAVLEDDRGPGNGDVDVGKIFVDGVVANLKGSVALDDKRGEPRFGARLNETVADR